MADTAENQELNETQLETLITTLKALKVELREQLSASAESAKPVDLDQPIGRLSRMDAMQQQHMAKAARRVQQGRLNRVNAALVVAARGDYGICQECEEPIGFARLKARPESAFCVVCQERSEKR
ncbi:MAG: TraR/DksA C4-type zinc finger protein [Deltaproteobacteria bacterium]|nr:TraR/DksA C4-type zinc finger protein [Deltaproteobacteria bacterium]